MNSIIEFTKSVNLFPVPTIGDGNCLLRSIVSGFEVNNISFPFSFDEFRLFLKENYVSGYGDFQNDEEQKCLEQSNSFLGHGTIYTVSKIYEICIVVLSKYYEHPPYIYGRTFTTYFPIFVWHQSYHYESSSYTFIKSNIGYYTKQWINIIANYHDVSINEFNHSYPRITHITNIGQKLNNIDDLMNEDEMWSPGDYL